MSIAPQEGPAPLETGARAITSITDKELSMLRQHSESVVESRRRWKAAHEDRHEKYEDVKKLQDQLDVAVNMRDAYLQAQGLPKYTFATREALNAFLQEKGKLKPNDKTAWVNDAPRVTLTQQIGHMLASLRSVGQDVARIPENVVTNSRRMSDAVARLVFSNSDRPSPIEKHLLETGFLGLEKALNAPAKAADQRRRMEAGEKGFVAELIDDEERRATQKPYTAADFYLTMRDPAEVLKAVEASLKRDLDNTQRQAAEMLKGRVEHTIAENAAKAVAETQRIAAEEAAKPKQPRFVRPEWTKPEVIRGNWKEMKLATSTFFTFPRVSQGISALAAMPGRIRNFSLSSFLSPNPDYEPKEAPAKQAASAPVAKQPQETYGPFMSEKVESKPMEKPQAPAAASVAAETEKPEAPAANAPPKVYPRIGKFGDVVGRRAESIVTAVENFLLAAALKFSFGKKDALAAQTAMPSDQQPRGPLPGDSNYTQASVKQHEAPKAEAPKPQAPIAEAPKSAAVVQLDAHRKTAASDGHHGHEEDPRVKAFRDSLPPPVNKNAHPPQDRTPPTQQRKGNIHVHFDATPPAEPQKPQAAQPQQQQQPQPPQASGWDHPFLPDYKEFLDLVDSKADQLAMDAFMRKARATFFSTLGAVMNQDNNHSFEALDWVNKLGFGPLAVRGWQAMLAAGEIAHNEHAHKLFNAVHREAVFMARCHQQPGYENSPKGIVHKEMLDRAKTTRFDGMRARIEEAQEKAAQQAAPESFKLSSIMRRPSWSGLAQRLRNLRDRMRGGSAKPAPA